MVARRSPNRKWGSIPPAPAIFQKGAVAKWEGGSLQKSPSSVRFRPAPPCSGRTTGSTHGLYPCSPRCGRNARSNRARSTRFRLRRPKDRTPRYERGNRDSSSRGGTMWARAANRIGHQPPKLAICEFESHRAFFTTIGWFLLPGATIFLARHSPLVTNHFVPFGCGSRPR